MNSFIKLKTGMCLNISQIEAFGPITPYSITVEGGVMKYSSIDECVCDKLHTCVNDISTEDLPYTHNAFCIPSEHHALNIYENDSSNEYDSYLKDFSILLKSGQVIYITEAEYNDILTVMGLSSEVYSNIDKHYTKYE